MTGRLAPLLLLIGWIGLPTWRPHLPVWVERWLYNPRERTERIVEATRSGHPGQAVAPAETAHRLAPDDPRTGFNAGTAHLAAGHAGHAAKVLEEVARTAGEKAPDLAPAAWYNLGNAHLAAGDAAAAVEAYRQTLLRNPGDADAKFNLELALQEREKKKMRMKGSREGSRGDRPGEREQSKQPGDGSPSDQQRQQGQDPGRSSQNGQEQSQGQAGQRQQPSSGADGNLPDFRNQPEMSSREAAALLSAVQSLERRQRREAALRRARQKSAKGKDW